MKRKLFGHRQKKRADTGRTPGKPYHEEGGDEDSYEEVKEHDTLEDGPKSGKSKGNPPGYEGKEHVRYKDPGHSPHHIRIPEDEPHMKSHVSCEEEHEMEDNYHHDIPDQTKYELEKKLKRARMKMDAPDQEDPKPLRGNIVHNVGYEGEEDTSGEEEMGPNEMQKASKEHRKKMIVAVARRKMKKQKSY